jgi:hypothetical protein
MTASVAPVNVWTQISPFLFSIGLILCSSASGIAIFRRASKGYASSTGRDLDKADEDYLRRACLYYADFSQLYAVTIPILLALHFDTAGSVGVVNVLYGTCLAITVVAIVVLYKLSAKKYGRSKFYLTPVAGVVLSVNGFALVITIVQYALNGR